jgi:hypothetical protein
MICPSLRAGKTAGILASDTSKQPDMTDLDHLSQIISHATAPAFLLGAVAGFVSILIGRLNGIIDRVRNLNLIAEDEAPRARPSRLIKRSARSCSAKRSWRGTRHAAAATTASAVRSPA